MATQNHYDKNGNHIGSSSDSSSGGGEVVLFLMILGIALWAAGKAIDWVDNFTTHYDRNPAPYSWVGAWYLLVLRLIKVIAVSLAYCFTELWNLTLTPYDHVNLLLSIMAVALLGGSIIFGLWKLADLPKRYKAARLTTWGIGIAAVAPALLGIIYYISALSLAWLFA